jgi:glycosyltransferase involved in cell wall biosynthesis
VSFPHGESATSVADVDDPDRTYRTLSVIVPVFNERNTVAEIVRRMREVRLPGGLQLEIIMVDDGSSDGSDRILSALEDSTVHVVQHKHNQGKGAAIATGIGKVTGDLVLIQDADLEYDPQDWPLLLAPVLSGEARVVYGSRFGAEHGASLTAAGRGNMMRLHLVGNKLLSMATSVLYRTKLTDMETCYKLFDRRVLDGMKLRAKKFDFEPEITAKVLKQGIRIHEVPITYAGREFHEGKKITWRDGFAALAALVRYRFTD